MNLYALLTRLIGAITGVLSRNSLDELDRLQALYRFQNDEELRGELAKQLEGTGAHSPRQPVTGVFRWLLRYSETPTLHALAIAVCLFERHPCDLPAGSTAYDEQRLAALGIVEGRNVQMDTGEGKTYAIALSAVALLARFPQVVVLTANDYLARRDLARVRPFLEAAGVACGHGAPGSSFRGVCYATIDTLCFGYLWRTYFPQHAPDLDYPADAAVIIDEIDSVLIDRNLSFTTSRSLPTGDALWEQVFDFAATVDDDEYAYNAVTDQVSLKADSWERLAELSARTHKPVSMLIDLVTAALWANRAQEGRNYVVHDGRILLINRVTGAAYESSDSTMKALEHLVLGNNPAVSLVIATVDGLTLLGRHAHVVGLSGTAKEDTLYYLQALGTLTDEILPRFPRHPGKARTSTSPSRAHTLSYLVERIHAVQPRPVVIGTWSPEEARVVADHLVAVGVGTAATIAAITSFDSDVDHEVIERAGEPGRVTVLSQGGSRGVDVRSAHRPLLIVVGRAYEPRLDRQFLGRVGRHGEPYDAEFVLDPNSPIWNKAIALRANLAGGVEPLERATARSLDTLQRDSWALRMQNRQQNTLLLRAAGQAEQAMAAAFARMRELNTLPAWSEYVTELCSVAEAELPTSGSAPTPPAAPAGGAIDGRPAAARILAAVERRQASDAPVTRFEAAVGAVDPEALADHRQLTVTGTPDEITALTAWVERRTAEVAADGDDRVADLFRAQVSTACAQRLPAPTSPHWRGALDVLHETLLMANATMLQATAQRLETLRVSATSAVYYRRAAYAVRNVGSMTRLTARQDLATNLSLVDTPEKLDDLFFSRDNHIWLPGRRADGTRFEPVGPQAPTVVKAPLDAGVEDLVQTFLQEQAARPGGLPIPEPSARILLQTVLRPVIGAPGPVTAALLRRQVDLIVEGLVAGGTRGRALRDHEKLIETMLADLFEKGVLPVALPRRWRGAAALGRARMFASTVSRLGLAATVLLLAVFGTAFVVPPVPVARTFVLVTTAVELFGFGSLGVDSPLLTLFALIAVGHAVLRATGNRSPLIALSRLAPVLVLILAVAVYNRGFADIPRTALIFVVLLVWAVVFLAAERFVLTMVGVHGTVVLAAVSVVVHVVTTASEGPRGLLAPLVVGVVAAAVGGPSLPVLVGAATYGRGRFRDDNQRTKVRIPLDPSLFSCLVAAAVAGLDIGVRGTAELLSFGVVQVVVFALIGRRRLGPQRVEGVLAQLRVGTSLSSDELSRHLRRALLWSIALAAAGMVGGVWLAVGAGAQMLATVVLAQWAGVLLVDGVLSLGNMVSVSGLATPFLQEAGTDRDRSPSLRERLRAWQQLRFARLIKFGIALLLLVRPLEWIADWTGLADAARTVWNLLVHLVT